MTYTEAVQKALNGEESGFGFLYENTYKSKLYLCLQYMKNESDAEDVLQDAYVKAFNSLQSLQDPEKFSSWLGQIVANTAKNALVKKNPVLFSYIPTDSDEDESFEEQIEDENVSNQPELSYTREETRQIVQELIDSLSDEQRMCILMYHMEDMPIKDIAATLNCSESTVKSRLNYGRKNLKAKAEEMEKKGYKLYSIAPLALLLLLLHTDAQAMYTEPAFLAAGRQVSNHVFSQIPSLGHGSGSENAGTSSGTTSGENSGENSGANSDANSEQAGTADSAASPSAEEAVKNGAEKAAKAGFFSTRTGQILIGVLGAAVLAGAGFGISTLVRDNNEENNRKQGGEIVVIQDTDDMAEGAPEETVENRVVTDDMYPDLLEGGLTKSHFEVLLAHAPAPMLNGEVSKDDLWLLFDDVTYDIGARNRSISSQDYIGVSGTYRTNPNDDGTDIGAYYDYNLSEMDNFLSVLLAEPLSDSLLDRGRYDDDTISGDTLTVPILDGDYGIKSTASITDAAQSGDTMTVNFTVTFDEYEKTTGSEDRYAILKQQDDGHYRIDSISLGTMDISSIIEQSNEQSGQQVSANTIKDVYEQVLSDVQAGKYTFSYANDALAVDGTSDGYQYFLRDLDNDGIQDLIVAEVYCPNSYTGVGVFFWNDCLIFTAQQQNGSWSAKQIDEIDILSAFIPSDGNGIDVMTDYGRGTGEAEYHRITIVNGTLSIGDYTDETDGTLVEWYDINDLSGLSGAG